MKNVLEVRDLTVRFGGITALSNVSFNVGEGELVGLIGPNGAGKTTMIRAVMGANSPSAGRIVLGGRDISRMKTAKRTALGLAMSHQIVRPFRNMSILENVTLAAGHGITAHPLLSLFRWRQGPLRERAREILQTVNIAELADAMPGAQPLGVLKRLEVARALALKPIIILLDEPLAGLGHSEIGPISEQLQKLNKAGVTILLIEHNLVEARRICSRFIVLDNGVKIADGPTDEVLRDKNVIAAYIGKDTADA